MIESFIHKGLQKFYQTGSTQGIQSSHKLRIQLILTNLDQAYQASDMNLPGLHLHRLKGARSEIWSVRVSGNWRITFRFNGINVEIVNYEDYH